MTFGDRNRIRTHASEETGACVKRRSADEGMERRKERSEISRGGVSAIKDASRKMGSSWTETLTRNEASGWRGIGRRDKRKARRAVRRDEERSRRRKRGGTVVKRVKCGRRDRKRGERVILEGELESSESDLSEETV